MSKEPEIVLRPKVAGLFRLRVGKGDDVRIDTGWFHNLILDVGLDLIANVPGAGFTDPLVNRCYVGSGNTAPTASDTSLQTLIASHDKTGVSNSTHSSTPYYGSKVSTYRFDQGQAAGNIAEVGVGYHTTGPTTDTLFSRALVLDEDGNPTTITVLSDEWLDVTYEFRVYAPVDDVTGTITESGTGIEYSYTIRALCVTQTNFWATSIANKAGALPPTPQAVAYSGALGLVTASAPGGAIITNGIVTLTNQSYSSGTYYRDMNCIFGLSATGTIRTVVFYTSLGAYQMEITPTISKVGTETRSFTFRIAWARKDLS